MDEDASGPGLEGEGIAELGRSPPDRRQGVGDGVAGVRLVAENGHRRPSHLVDPPGDERRERVDVAVLGPPDECRVQSSLPATVSSPESGSGASVHPKLRPVLDTLCRRRSRLPGNAVPTSAGIRGDTAAAALGLELVDEPDGQRRVGEDRSADLDRRRRPTARKSRTSASSVTPPIATTGSRRPGLTSYTIRSATGLIAGPDSPP